MVTLEKVLEEVQKNNRVCPNPQKCNQLYQMLPNKKQNIDGGWEPAVPLILAAWYEATALDKTYRFRQHLEWASEYNCLTEVFDLIQNLTEEDWHHVND